MTHEKVPRRQRLRQDDARAHRWQAVDLIVTGILAREAAGGHIDVQLRPGGRGIAPLLEDGGQILTLATKLADGATRRRELCEVLYVRLRTREDAVPNRRRASSAPPDR